MLLKQVLTRVKGMGTAPHPNNVPEKNHLPHTQLLPHHSKSYVVPFWFFYNIIIFIFFGSHQVLGKSINSLFSLSLFTPKFFTVPHPLVCKCQPCMLQIFSKGPGCRLGQPHFHDSFWTIMARPNLATRASLLDDTPDIYDMYISLWTGLISGVCAQGAMACSNHVPVAYCAHV